MSWCGGAGCGAGEEDLSVAGSAVSLKGIKGVGGGTVGVIVRVVVVGMFEHKTKKLGCKSQRSKDRETGDLLFHVHSDVPLV